MPSAADRRTPGIAARFVELVGATQQDLIALRVGDDVRRRLEMLQQRRQQRLDLGCLLVLQRKRLVRAAFGADADPAPKHEQEQHAQNPVTHAGGRTELLQNPS